VLKKWLIAVGALTTIGIVPAFYPRVYVVRESGSGPMYWNANEALLFMQVSTSGSDMSYLRYALEPLLVRMGNVRKPSDEHCSQILVIQVTAKDVQYYQTDLHRYAEEPYCGFHFNLFEGDIYAVSWPMLWIWSGTRFERPTPEKYAAYAAALAGGQTPRQLPWGFDNSDGWSMRAFGQAAPSVVLDGHPMTIVFHGKAWPSARVSVDLTRAGQTPQTIWSLDGEPRRVVKSEYERVFAQH
jgi:hypothetical protein